MTLQEMAKTHRPPDSWWNEMSDHMVKTVFDWQHFLVYLAGPIDAASDGGKGWRIEWREKLLSLGLKSEQILSPTQKPLRGTVFELDNESEIMKKLRSEQDWPRLVHTVGQIAHIDLRMVDKSDLILVNFPRMRQEPVAALYKTFDRLVRLLKDGYSIQECDMVMSIVNDTYAQALEIIKDSHSQVPTYGTMHEIVVARQQRKPVCVVWEGGKQYCSAWLMWLVGHENVFSTFDEMLTHLRNKASGEAPIDIQDWLLLDLDKHQS